jgi:hypothetical protein
MRLHCARIDAKPSSNLAHAVSTPRGLQSCNFQVGSYPGAAKLFALILGPPKPGADSFLNPHTIKTCGLPARYPLKHFSSQYALELLEN